MRLFGKPGGTRAQLRAALLTVPFDLPASVVVLVHGPLVVVGGIFRAGAQAARAFRPGAQAASVFRPGAQAGTRLGQ